MNLEGIRLSEISTGNRLMVAKGERWEVGEMGESDFWKSESTNFQL